MFIYWYSLDLHLKHWLKPALAWLIKLNKECYKKKSGVVSFASAGLFLLRIKHFSLLFYFNLMIYISEFVLVSVIAPSSGGLWVTACLRIKVLHLQSDLEGRGEDLWNILYILQKSIKWQWLKSGAVWKT